MVGTATDEVEGYVERVDVGIVGIVDERAAMLALLHLQAHGDSLQLRHSPGDVGGRNTER